MIGPWYYPEHAVDERIISLSPNNPSVDGLDPQANWPPHKSPYPLVWWTGSYIPHAHRSYFIEVWLTGDLVISDYVYYDNHTLALSSCSKFNLKVTFSWNSLNILTSWSRIAAWVVYQMNNYGILRKVFWSHYSNDIAVIVCNLFSLLVLISELILKGFWPQLAPCRQGV